MRPAPPVERVRRRLIAQGLPEAAAAVPVRYERLGQVLLLRLPEWVRPWFAAIGQVYLEELGVDGVLRHAGPVAGELRQPPFERIAGDASETELREHGVIYRFDAARLLFSRGNKTERARIGRLVGPGETVVDLFAGIGYFTLPAARAHPEVRVIAVEINPLAHLYLEENLRLNRVEAQVTAHLGDNREIPLPLGAADRVLLGYLPTSLPWIPRALALLRSRGGYLHVHLVEEVRAPQVHSASVVADAVSRAGGSLERSEVRRVKPYGPGNEHRVVDAFVRPGTTRR
ncbi:MAG: class I SAM-dependent methyltransferase family protein [Thermoplasmata archaeon]|nr:class I SAM-dependent methyltransferase family protein [Thermoplasmata archaeon]